MEDFAKWAGVVLAAVAVGYPLSFLLDRFILRLLINDRFSSILASCTLLFIALMAGTTIYLTQASPFVDGPIIIPPLPVALGFLIAMTAVGVVRVKRYSDAYVYNDDQAVFDVDLDDQSLYDDEVNAWDEKNSGRGYFRRHWVGHLSLPLSYWVNGALISSVIVAIAEYISWKLRESGGSLRILAAAALLFLFVSMLVWLWSTVGIWRSAYWHRRRGGSALVSTAVRALIFLGAAGILLRTGNIALQARELGNLAMGKDPLGSAAEMTVSKDGRDLVLRGAIAMGTADRFAAMLDANPTVDRIVLTSGGGRLIEAERMADRIRKDQLDTRVDDHCESACIHLLIAGEDRTAPNRARIGFHQPSFPGTSPSEMAAEAERMRLRYLEAGIDRYFAWRALATPATSMWYPTADELVAANVITSSDVVIRGGSRTNDKASAAVPGEESLSDQRLRMDLKDAAVQINRSAPRQLDGRVRLERAMAEGFTLTYHYSVSGEPIDVASSKIAMSREVRAQTCADAGMAAAIYDGARFVYSYADSNGKKLFSFNVDACNG
jgi:hypothetical protein